MSNRPPLALLYIRHLDEWRSVQTERSVRGVVYEAVILLRSPSDQELHSLSAGLSSHRSTEPRLLWMGAPRFYEALQQLREQYGIPHPCQFDPDWHDTNVWDCPDPKCGVTRMCPEVKTCLLCDTPQPEGAVYLGRCYRIKMSTDPTFKLTDLPSRPLIKTPRDQSLANVRQNAAQDAALFADLLIKEIP